MQNNTFKSYYILTSLLALTISCNTLKQADKVAMKGEMKMLYPIGKFDSLIAKSMLETGNTTIKGVVYKKTNKIAIVNAKRYGANVIVTLIPATKYFMEYYNLRQKKENKKTKVYMSEEAFKYRLEVKSDSYGRFVFEKIKPGKYFIQAFMTTTNYYTKDVEVGTNSYGTRYYEKQKQYETKTHRLEKFVEINSGNDFVEAVLK